MQIGSSSFYDIGSSYTIKLNNKEMLVVEDDPVAKERAEHKKTQKEKELEEKKAQERQKNADPSKLSEDEKRVVKELAARDSEVKAHEAAHQAASGGMAGAASYTYQQGPDGKMYAVGGEVPIAMQAGATPQETIANARKVAAAAMAPGDPSSQDYSVASSARVMEMKAQQQLRKEKQEEMQGKSAYTGHNSLDISV